MPILTKEVEANPTGKLIKYYRDLGYDAKHNQPLMVDVDDLPRNSHIKIDVLCDMCKENIMPVSYQEYNISIENTGSYVCKQCSPQKAKQNNLKKYGVSNVMQVDKIKDKSRKTLMERYGVENYAQTEDYRKKMEYTMMNKYGVKNASQMDEYKEKCRNTCIEKYGDDYGKYFSQRAISVFKEKTGYSHPLRSPSIKEKRKQTNMNKYGVDNPSRLPEVREKMSQTLYANSSQKTSRQQLYLFNLYKSTDPTTELNYPISHYNADICLPNEKIDIEVDFGGHNLLVKTGKLTQEEFNQKEIIRNNIIKRQGYRQMRIISSKDLLPSDKTLLQMLSEAKQYFSETNHSWCSYDIDKSLLFNAEHKDGIPYSFGELRTIKDSDLPNNTNNKNLKGA